MNSERDLLLQLFRCIDHTTLSPTDNAFSVRLFAERTLRLQAPQQGVGTVASVCTWLPFVPVVKDTFRAALMENIHVAAVAGCFPSSQGLLDTKIAEVSAAAQLGADEMDIVFPLAHIDDEPRCRAELEAMRQQASKLTMKCILETGELRTPDRIARATQLAISTGYDFVKTSTGKTSIGATMEAVEEMLKVLKIYKINTGKTVGLKVSGGISSPEEALQYAHLAMQYMGDNYIDPQTFRIGTSRLTEKLFSFLTQ